ncbi:hypothetical protein BYT27DRAFT_7191415 [Phlegmacium glaucopus]|nr:hypothetical protein BYT27DRAFT_7191415 [Phlegmacium glaucopus]
MPSQAAERPRHRGRLKAPNIPTSLDNVVPSPPRPLEVAPVFNTMTRIWAASAVIDIIRGDKEENSCLPTATLDRVSTLSTSLWEEILPLPLSIVPSIQSSLTMYELILVDIQQILSSNDPLGISDDTIDCQLDDFMVQFQEALNPLKGTISQSNPPNSTHFFQNAHHLLISGGNFNNNPVVHDPVLREQSHQILRVLYIQCGVLFG